MGGEGVEGELPGAAEQVAGVAADGGGTLVDEFDGVETGTAVEPAPVVGEAPGIDDLVGEESAGEGERKRQTTEAVGDLYGVLDRTRMRRQVSENKSGLFTREYAELEKVGARPPMSCGLSRGNDDGAVRAGAEPAAIAEDGGGVGVVEDQEPGLVGAVQVVPDEIRGWT